MQSDLERELLGQLRFTGFPSPQTEFRFDRERLWRFDLAWPTVMLAVECEGGVSTRGRHVRPRGYLEDCRKYNAAVLLGWRVLRFTGEQIKSGEALSVIEKALGVEDG